MPVRPSPSRQWTLLDGDEVIGDVAEVEEEVGRRGDAVVKVEAVVLDYVNP